MTTQAEGVETEGQFRVLADARCTEAQGYLFSRPVTAEALPEVLERLGRDSLGVRHLLASD